MFAFIMLLTEALEEHEKRLATSVPHAFIIHMLTGVSQSNKFNSRTYFVWKIFLNACYQITCWLNNCKNYVRNNSKG